ncbi:MAG: 3-oxoadipate enol-lactonase [Candidatus Eremiobacteraeota bacterium]|nr:3-oxoadipate enol-lactonase [Candidatus Eremiobacteraeota bacterium]
MSFVSLSGFNAFYELSGRAHAPVVLLANSLGTNVHVWDAQVAELAASYRVLRYDMRGHGLTDSGSLAGTSIASLADDVAALLGALDIRAVNFVGLSIGGMIGQQFAAAYPERVDKLVLCATGNRIGTRAVWDARIDAVERAGVGAIVPDVLQRWFTLRTHDARPELVRGFATMLERTPAAGYAAACRAIRDADLRTTDAAVQCSTLVIAGSDDPVTNTDVAAELQGAIAGARLYVVAGAAHIVCAEAPETFNAALLRFLGEPVVSAGAV